METNPTKEFLYRNGIKQIELAEYLGISKTTVSRYTTGTLEIPVRNVNAILRNPFGWDTSMFKEMSSTTITANASGNGKSSISIASGNISKDDSTNVTIVALQKEIEILRQQLAEEKKRSERYWEMIQKILNK